MTMLSVGEWLDGPRIRPASPPDAMPQPPRHGVTDPASSAVAIALCLNTPIALSMTPFQLDVLRTLCRLQQEDAGFHSLLPGVMDAFLDLARRPWWDAGVATVSSPASR